MGGKDSSADAGYRIGHEHGYNVSSSIGKMDMQNKSFTGTSNS